MKFENTDVWGFEHAIRGARNPMNSWNKSDSVWCEHLGYEECIGCYAYYDDKCHGIQPEKKQLIDFVIGEKDMDLMQRLIRGGSEHRKFMRQIFVSVDITAPMYLWSELDTYKIGTVANSTSKMHKIATTPITIDCFETDDLETKFSLSLKDGIEPSISQWTNSIIDGCEFLRQKYLETKDKRYWKELIRWLPESWLQTRTWTANYEVLRNIVHQRKGHKLTEWQSFIDWVHTLPYAEELIFWEDNNEG